MVTAEVTFSRDQLVNIDHPMQYIGIDWETYEEISEELGETKPVHVTFNRGILTIMPPTELHEVLTGLLHDFIRMTSLLMRTNVIATGGATMRSRTRLIGVEPDLSYFVERAGRHRVKDYVENELKLPPDIVVEIDIHHRSDDKFDIYAALGVSEFWQYDGRLLKMYKLGSNTTYEQIDRSVQLPVLTSEVLTEFLNRGQEEEDQFSLLADFQNWLLNSK